MPAVNILEQEDAFKVEIMAAGWKKENFKIEVENRTLKISAEKQSQSEEQKGKYTHREFNVNAFRRSFSLPSTVDSDKIEAQYQEGILVLTLPKREEAKVRKVVEIV
ncbi:MAG: Hsp20/alpha crystallin family protein [Cytophagales bacterium]|nr:MAG: Hsp20/alpha crystallin family protein [Cytophagales bacterium]